jgi:predicted esterase
MPGWYDITSLSDVKRSEDEEGITSTKKYFHDLISEEIQNGIPANRIILGGFSQGGAMSLHAGLTCPQKLAGIFGLSCYLLLQDKFKSLVEASGDANKKTPIFMGHGEIDPVVPYKHGKATGEELKQMGYDVDFHTYP